jgi:hypothetical protein
LRRAADMTERKQAEDALAPGRRRQTEAESAKKLRLWIIRRTGLRSGMA